MKVCHMTVTHKATDNRIFEKECKSLYNNGYEISVIAPNIQDCELDGLRIYGVSLSSHPLARLFYGAKKIYKKALEVDADVYHFHDIELFKYGVKLKKRGKKVIFDSHEDWIGYTQEIAWLPALIKNYMAANIRHSYKKHLQEFDAVITVSPHIVDNLKKYSDKVWMITNYPIIQPQDSVPFTLQDYQTRKKKFCYAGTVYTWSNQQFILKAMQDINDITYYIIGPVAEKYKRQLTALDGARKANFIPRIPKAEVLKHYANSISGFVILNYSPNSNWEKGTIGSNKIFEYMLAGLPIICTDFECWKEMIIDKYQCGIYVKPGDTEAIQKAIQAILDDPEKAYAMGQRGQQAVMKEFNWHTQEKKLLELYSKL